MSIINILFTNLKAQWRGYPLPPTDGALTFNFPISFSTICFGVYKNAGSSSNNGMTDIGASVFEISLDSFKIYNASVYKYPSIFSIGY